MELEVSWKNRIGSINIRTSQATSDSDEEPDISRACCLLARTESYNPNEKVVPMYDTSEETDGMHLQEASQDQIKYNSPGRENIMLCHLDHWPGTAAR